MIYLSALAIWTSLYRQIRRKTWLVVWIGFLLLSVHRVLEMWHLSVTVSVLSTLPIAVIALTAAYTTKKFIQRVDRMQKSMPKVKHTESVAERLATHFIYLKDKISYYEQKAEQFGFPKYPEKPDTEK